MKYEIEVKRIRPTMTQGSVQVWVNGKLIETYGDTIELIDDEWKSSVKDQNFISAVFRDFSF